MVSVQISHIFKLSNNLTSLNYAVKTIFIKSIYKKKLKLNYRNSADYQTQIKQMKIQFGANFSELVLNSAHRLSEMKIDRKYLDFQIKELSRYKTHVSNKLFEPLLK